MTSYSLPALPYALDALEPHLNAELLELHHSKHHAAYVKGANDTLDQLAEARKSGKFDNINQLEKNFAFNLSGHVLHSSLWGNMSPEGGGTPGGALAKAIDRDFGSFDAFKGQLDSAASTIQGSGWGALTWEPLAKKLVIEQVFDHQSNLGNGTLPILVVDMWEHAYYLQYKNVKKDWLKGFWELVNWTDVAARFDKVSRTDLGL